MKRILSLVIAMMIVMTSFGTVPFMVSAAEEEVLPGYKLEPVEILGTTTDLYDQSCTRDKAFDGDTTTYAEMINDTAWVGVDLGTASQISYIRFYPRDAWTSRATGGKFQGASDPEFTDAVDLYVIETEPPAGWNTVYITDTTAYRYVRYYTAPSGYINISEIEFYYEETDPNATPRPTAAPTPTPTPTPTPEPTATPKPTATPRPPYADDVAIWDGTYDVSWYNENDTEFHISTAEQLAGVAAINNGVEQAAGGIVSSALNGKTIILDNDIYLNNVLTWGDDGVFATENANSFDPITQWAGTFDGQGHTIYGAYVDDTNTNYAGAYVGLFGHLWGGTVENLNISNAYVVANNGWKVVGIVAGRNQGGLMKNIHVTDSYVAGNNASIGGIVGGNDTIHEGEPYPGTVDGCSTDATVTVTFIEGGSCGGIVGANKNENGLTQGISTVKNCTSSAKIIGRGYMGGIVAENMANVDNCTYKNNSIKSAYEGQDVWVSAAGGIVGANKINGEQIGRVTNCAVINADIYVQSWEAAGGVVGFNPGGEIANCYCVNSTIENLYPSSAGITGHNGEQNGSVTNCYVNNNEIISGWNNKASIVYTNGTATNCYGPVSDTIVLASSSVTATDCDTFDADYVLTTSGAGLVDTLNAWVAENEGYNTWVMGENGPEFATDTEPEVTYVAEVDGVQYKTLAAAVEAAADGATVTLLGNANGDGVVIDKNITIDLGGYTYTVDGALVGSTGTANNAFQILSGNDVTIKNGSIVAANDDITVVIQNYANLTLEDVTVDGSAIADDGDNDSYPYMVSVNSGDVVFTGATNIVAPEYGTAFDSCQFGSYATPTVTVNTTGTITGAIEATGGNIAIAGGTYTVAIDEAWCADGYVPVVNEDGTYGVEKQNLIPLVSVYCYQDGEVAVEFGYDNLADALNDAADLKEMSEADSVVVKLNGDATGAGAVIDGDITIDFGGYTYTLTEGVGSTGTETNGLQLLAGNNVTLKNGTLTVAAESADKFYILVQNYANLTVEDMNLDGTYLDRCLATSGASYVLSNNSGTVNITGETNITANNDGALAVAFDVYKFGSYEAPTVNVSTTGTITGAIEVTGGTLSISGGTYTVAIDEAWCADGFVPADNGDGTYGVKIAVTVALTDTNVVTTGVEESAVVVLASYNGTRLVDVQYVTITADADIVIADTGLDTTGATSISAMLLKDLTNIMPLCTGAVK